MNIPDERYSELIRAETLLQCLQAAGVDNWEGYEFAVDMFLNDYAEDQIP